MKAKQYIYTSWKNGNNPDKGFMIYSKSEDITKEECENIKFVMQYTPPADLPAAPSKDQIFEEFPYSFAFFKLNSGRLCIAQSTYLGKDYSGRFGNYIIYALVFEEKELCFYPTQFFGEKFIKLNMTNEELNASSPVAPLKELEINSWGNIVNDELLMEFISEREYEFAYLLSAFIYAKQTGMSIYINDTREHLVLWMAAIHRVLPIKTVKNITFNTYVFDHKKFGSNKAKESGLNLTCLGVRPDANYFNYSNGCKSSRQIVMDFKENYITDKINVFDFTKELAASYSLDMEIINEFIKFLDKIKFYDFNKTLDKAFKFFKLIKLNKLGLDDSDIIDIINFGVKYCTQDLNSQAAAKMADIIHKDKILNIKTASKVFCYLYKYAFFMKFTIHDYLYYMLLNSMEENKVKFSLIEDLNKNCKEGLEDFLIFFYSEDILLRSEHYIKNSSDEKLILFICEFIIKYYNLVFDIIDKEEILTLLNKSLEKLAILENKVQNVYKLILTCDNNLDLICILLEKFIPGLNDEEKQKFCEEFKGYMQSLNENLRENFEDEILKNTGISEVIVYIKAQKIERSKNAFYEFWKIYDELKKYENIDLSFLIMVYVKDSNLKNLNKMILEVPSENIKNSNAVKLIAKKYIEFGVKNLFKVEDKILFKLEATLRERKIIDDEINLLLAICFYKNLMQKMLQNDVYPEFSYEYKKYQNLNISNLSKKDYNLYISAAIKDILACICCCEDLKALIEFIYNENYFGLFVTSLIAYLKKIKRKKAQEYENITSSIKEYVENYKDSDNKAKEFFDLMGNNLSKI